MMKLFLFVALLCAVFSAEVETCEGTTCSPDEKADGSCGAKGESDCAGRTVFIIGGSRGIGLGLVKAYQERGMNVVTTTRKPIEALNELENVKVMEGIDVTDDDFSETLSESFVDDSIDVLIYNAGVMTKTYKRDGMLDVSDGKWVFDVNVWGAVRAMNALQSKVKSGGQIMLMSSIAGSLSSGICDSGMCSSYFMSKSALNAYGQIITAELVKKKVAVAIMHPGYVLTDMVEPWGNQPGDVLPFQRRNRDDLLLPMITVDESVEQMMAVMDKVSMENTGTYWQYDGTVLDW